MTEERTSSEIKRGTPDHLVLPWIVERWSPYAYSDPPVSAEALRSVFEAMRWAPSSYNEQPWRYIVATKEDPEAYAKILSCLVEGNQEWAMAAPVLALGLVKKTFTKNGKMNRVALHDLGAASAHIAFEATSRGIRVHQMGGILPDVARVLYGIPDDFDVVTALALGYEADDDDSPEIFRKRDHTPRTRKPLAEYLFGGAFGEPSELAR